VRESIYLLIYAAVATGSRTDFLFLVDLEDITDLTDLTDFLIRDNP